MSLIKVKKKVKEKEVCKSYNINDKVLYLIIIKFWDVIIFLNKTHVRCLKLISHINDILMNMLKKRKKIFKNLINIIVKIKKTYKYVVCKTNIVKIMFWKKYLTIIKKITRYSKNAEERFMSKIKLKE